MYRMFFTLSTYPYIWIYVYIYLTMFWPNSKANKLIASWLHIRYVYIFTLNALCLFFFFSLNTLTQTHYIVSCKANSGRRYNNTCIATCFFLQCVFTKCMNMNMNIILCKCKNATSFFSEHASLWVLVRTANNFTMTKIYRFRIHKAQN